MSPTAIDVFCGAGGLSLGLEKAGFQTLFAVDNDSDSCKTYRTLVPRAALHEGDASWVDFTKWSGVDLVAGGPPCQPFSTGGRRLGKKDERDLLPIFVRAVSQARPKAFLLENVPGLASPAHRDYLVEVLAPLADEYSIFGPYLINAADYGVPQSRRRLIVIGTIEGDFHVPYGCPGRRPVAGDVLTFEPNGLPNHSKIVYAKRPDLRPNPYHGQLFNGGGRPIDLDAPAPTILASAGGNKTHFIDCSGLVPPYHSYLMRGGIPRIGELIGARRLTVAECASLQSFPNGAKISGARSSQYEQVGNAVPPRLAAIFGDAVFSAITRTARPTRASAAA
jgi:DNA (cytosine-5)-methyltransferase 1